MRKNKEQMMYELGWNAALEMSAVMVEKDLPGPRKTDEDEEFERIAREQEAREAEDLHKTHPIVLEASIQSFNAWKHSCHPNQYSIERRAFLAGFEAGLCQANNKIEGKTTL